MGRRESKIKQCTGTRQLETGNRQLLKNEPTTKIHHRRQRR